MLEDDVPAQLKWRDFVNIPGIELSETSEKHALRAKTTLYTQDSVFVWVPLGGGNCTEFE